MNKYLFLVCDKTKSTEQHLLIWLKIMGMALMSYLNCLYLHRGQQWKKQLRHIFFQDSKRHREDYMISSKLLTIRTQNLQWSLVPVNTLHILVKQDFFFYSITFVFLNKQKSNQSIFKLKVLWVHYNAITLSIYI